MQKEDLQLLIRTVPPIVFCREYLFSSNAWIFEDISGQNLEGSYHDFRCTIASLIDENPNNISLVGSAKFGLSLKPESNFRKFRDNSDIDIVIISTSLFSSAWSGYRNAYYNGYKQLIERHSKNIFRNFLFLKPEEYDEYKTEYLRDVWLKMNTMRREVSLQHRLRHKINFRIYATWQDAENYHVSGIYKLQENLKNADE